MAVNIGVVEAPVIALEMLFGCFLKLRVLGLVINLPQPCSPVTGHPGAVIGENIFVAVTVIGKLVVKSLDIIGGFANYLLKRIAKQLVTV